MSELSPLLPELTRSLRALGAPPRDDSSAEHHGRYFAPLLDARRRAADAADMPAVLRHFDPQVIEARLREALAAIAAHDGGASEPLRRAVEARIVEAADPLFTALRLLGTESAEMARQPSTGSIAQDAEPAAGWLAALANVFRTADDCWFAIQRVLRGEDS